MHKRSNQTYIEWGFVGLLAVFCAVLSALQYHWTGEISRAEAERLRAGLNEQAQQFCNEFDSALTESCQALAPDNEKIDDGNRQKVHVQSFKKWESLRAHPIFSRVAVVVPKDDGVQLFEQNLTTGKLVPMQWPAEWKDLQSELSNRNPHHPWPFENASGTLIELPVGKINFDHPPDGPAGPPPGGMGGVPENEWMIFELDTNYLLKTWLPELTRTYLNLEGLPVNDVNIKTILPPYSVIFSSPSNDERNSESPVTIRFNRQGRELEDYHGPAPAYRWLLEVRPRPGALEAIVSASHRRDLGVAILLTGMILAAGIALVHLTRRSRRLAEAQMNFVANVSHELRTPLTVIRGAGHNLLRGVAHGPEQVEKYSKLIIQHTEQLTEMVEQILELAGIRKNSSVAMRDSVSVPKILREAIAATKYDTDGAHCEVHLELPLSLPSIVGDAAALRRVFQNLIINAAKHGGQGGWIGITAIADEQSQTPAVEIQVADRGPGIPENEVAEIFKPFFRGTAAQAMQVRGSGLGLSLVREIVEAHGGTVSAKSETGRGAIFIVRLPAAQNTK